MRLKLVECEECGHKTLMVGVRVEYAQLGGIDRHWNVWYCSVCGKTYKLTKDTTPHQINGEIMP